MARMWLETWYYEKVHKQIKQVHERTFQTVKESPYIRSKADIYITCQKTSTKTKEILAKLKQEAIRSYPSRS